MKKSRLMFVFMLAVFVSLALALGPAGEATAASDVVNIKIAGARVKDPWYAFSQALAAFINKKSKWLKAEAVATAGLTANIEMVREKPKDYIGLAPTSTTLHARPGHEWGEARKTYTGARFIANITTMTQLLVTYDSKIKSPQDLVDKTIDVGRKGAGNTPDHLAILKAWGILDKVKLIYTGFGGGAKRLMDGFCDATFLIINHTYPDKFSKGRYIDQLETKKPVYYLGFDRDMLLKLRQTEHGTVPVKIPAGALDPKTQPQTLWAFNDPVYIMADESMDPKVVEEVTRIIFETEPEEWAKWHPQGAHMTEKFKPATPVPAVVPAHPGTKTYYDKHGIKMEDLADLLK
ncbi:MAG: TAXI family TRAP transporter solute-binding subunit [Deltaproteobacteria bacterium]|nr:TAXI family TRAP transporter solute-binding subunit [Deltaproteobacteria bacterium]